MKSIVKTFAVCCAALGLASSAVAADVQDVVVSGAGKQPVRSEKFGTCVQTKWNAKDDICGAPPEPKQVVVEKPAVQPVTKLEHEQLTIYFAFNKALLSNESTSKLDQIADAVNHSPKVTKVNIVGYTDEIGSDSYNTKLSVKRANAVKAYLDTKMRIPAGVLGLRGLGKADPVTGNTCDKIKKRKAKIACLAKDRRTEIEFEFEK